MPADLHFLRPLWFLALVPIVMLLALLWRRHARDQAWRALVDAHLLPHLLVGADGAPRRLPLTLLGLGWLLAVTALAGPVWERLPQPVFSAAAERVVLLDLSPSMNAADIRPSRLARARFELLDLLRATKEGQVALIAFGPEPFLVSPLTADAQTIAAQVPRLATDLIPVPGPRRTDRALEMAGELLSQAGAVGGDVILITDAIDDDPPGEKSADSPAVAAARGLAASGVRVSVLGIGTLQGAPVPRAKGGFSDDPSGAIRFARLDPKGLEAVAAAGRGRYVALDAGDRDTLALVDESALQPGKVVEQEGLATDQWREEGPWLLLALLPMAALGFRRGWLLPIVALVVVLPPEPGWALGWGDLWQRRDQQAAQALAAGDHESAANHFEDPAWRAAARYRTGDYKGALDALANLSGPEADYNRGNALARLGRLDEAVAAYERTLKQVPDHGDAKANLDLIRQLKERQKPPPPQSQDSKQSQPGSQGGQGQSEGAEGREGNDASKEATQPKAGEEQAANQVGRGAQAPGEGQDSSGAEGAGQTDQAESGQADDAEGEAPVNEGKPHAQTSATAQG
ncbi:MAG: vWA domain-containing protein, partial [Anaerolineae bacterium]